MEQSSPEEGKKARAGSGAAAVHGISQAAEGIGRLMEAMAKAYTDSKKVS